MRFRGDQQLLLVSATDFTPETVSFHSAFATKGFMSLLTILAIDKTLLAIPIKQFEG